MEWYNSLTDNQKYALVGGVIALVVGLIVLIVMLASPHLPSCLKEGGTYTEVGSSGSPSYSSAWADAYANCQKNTPGCTVYGLSPGNNGEACATWCSQFQDADGKPYGAYSGSLKTDTGTVKPVQTDFCTGADPTAQGEQNCFCAPQCASSLPGFQSQYPDCQCKPTNMIENGRAEPYSSNHDCKAADGSNICWGLAPGNKGGDSCVAWCAQYKDSVGNPMGAKVNSSTDYGPRTKADLNKAQSQSPSTIKLSHGANDMDCYCMPSGCDDTYTAADF